LFGGEGLLNQYTTTDIANLAMSHLMQGQSIQDVTSEQSPQANAARVFLPIAIGSVLRDFAWPFATAYQNLALVTTYPTNQGYYNQRPAYLYAYRVPSDCVTVRRISSGSRMDNLYTRVPFTLSSDASGPLILTDMPNAQIEYTQFQVGTSLFTDDFVMALSFKLAWLCAARVTGGDPFKLGPQMETKYLEAVSLARANALNEVEFGESLDSEFILVRESGGTSW
jgi:hypothetical protein